LILSGMAGAMAVWCRRQMFVYASGLLLNAAGIAMGAPWTVADLTNLVGLNLCCLALGAGIWSILEKAVKALDGYGSPLSRTRGRGAGGEGENQHPFTNSEPSEGIMILPLTPNPSPPSTGERGARPLDLRGNWLPFSHVAEVVTLGGLALMTALGLAVLFGSGTAPATGPFAWPTLVLLTAAIIASLRDPTDWLRLRGLYAAGLLALSLLILSIDPDLRWWLVPCFAGYLLLTTLLWHKNPRWGVLHHLLPLANPSGWFVPSQAVVACVVTTLSVPLCLAFTIAQPALGPLTLALLLPAILLLVRNVHEPQRPTWQSAALGLGVLVSVETGWAFLGAGVTHLLWLVRGGVLLATLAPLTILYGVGLTRWLPANSGWPRLSRRWAIGLGGLSLLALIAVLAQETLLFAPGIGSATELPGIGFIVAVAAAIVVMIVTAIFLAILPDLDLFELSERGRTAYVYAAEVMLSLMFVHLRLTAPSLFRGNLVEYWMFAIMALAFLGAAAGEFFRRLRLPVLAEPLDRTGMFLSVLPVLGFWLRPGSFGSYAALWFLVGLLYVVLSFTRRSLAFVLLAFVAINFGLWAILHENQMAFIEHPQLWLIPFALTGLLAEHLNRDRLSKSQKNTIRYVSLTVIYLSSTAETMLTGLGQDPIRAVALVVLSLLGVFAGMMMRVRAFLFLGSLFLLLGIVSVVRHAALVAQGQGRIVWLVAGIVLGMAIFALFAVFEKRRNELLNLLKKLKDWD